MQSLPQILAEPAIDAPARRQPHLTLVPVTPPRTAPATGPSMENNLLSAMSYAYVLLGRATEMIEQGDTYSGIDGTMLLLAERLSELETAVAK